MRIYRLAFTHTSLSKETKNGFKENNERLEFLGDTILDGIVSHYLYIKYPFKDEGFLTQMRSKIVSRTSLNFLSLKLGLDEMLMMKDMNIKSNRVYGNALEALIGAVFLDKGFKKTKEFIIDKLLLAHIDLDNLEAQDIDDKSKFIHQMQREKKEYEIHDEMNGEQFVCTLIVDEEVVAKGFGFSKKLAEQDAARKFFEKGE